MHMHVCAHACACENIFGMLVYSKEYTLSVSLISSVMKTSVIWDIAPCSLTVVDQCFRDAYCLHHQDDVLILQSIPKGVQVVR
jgi:hypothetical protein